MINLYEALVDMFSSVLMLLFSGTGTVASLNTFYPPLNHTTFISNTSYGTYGGIYTAPSDRASSSSRDDVYNYCSMPHPRVETYSVPPPVAYQSVQAKLVYLEYFQRHQRRTPYNILPGGEVLRLFHSYLHTG